MASIENLTNKIREEANARKKEILSEAEAEKSRIIEKKVAEAKTYEVEAIKKSKAEAITRKERIISNAELTVRNKKLEAKQNVISKVFEEAVEGLCNLSEEDFKSFLKQSIKNSDITGEENLILNSKGKKIISNEFLNEVNQYLKKAGKKGELKIAEETGTFKGGFVLEKNGIEINNTFEALVNSMKDDLEYDVAMVLFN